MTAYEHYVSSHFVTCLNNEVIIQLVKTKCLPVLYYALDVGLCPISRDQARSLDYAVHSCFRKFFQREISLLLSSV